ncbi:MAG: ACT domain-containing protein [Clostridia bacterium]|nr:ACT domain-containing protein [Clostridia bacterium]
MKDSNLLLVKADVLPEVFLKVIKAKYLLSSKKAKSASEAARLCGISRSAFYKYKDSVFHYEEQGEDGIVNLSAVLENVSGVLSDFISALTGQGANILTINQGMPSGGVASVTVSYRSKASSISVEEILSELSQIKGVVSVHQVLGEI